MVMAKINSHFSDEFGYNDVIENGWKYVPHMTLFKILDQKKFKNYKSGIEEIVNLWLKDNLLEDFFYGFGLFLVNSKFRPEIQILIY